MRGGLVLGALAALAAGAARGADPFECMIEPHVVADVGSPVEGVIGDILVERGAFVKKGQVLATLESSVEKAGVAVARARAEMDVAVRSADVRSNFGDRKLARVKEMRRDQYVSDFDVDEATTEKELAQLSKEEAEKDKELAELEFARASRILEQRSIRSPVDGVVVERFLNESERVEQEPLMKIAQIDPLNVEVILPVGMLDKVKPGMGGVIRPEAPEGVEYRGRVVIVDPVVNAASGMFGVRLELANPERKIPAGVKCTVEFVPAATAGR
jgi:RND family efflux transporter MFP subunit